MPLLFATNGTYINFLENIEFTQPGATEEIRENSLSA